MLTYARPAGSLTEKRFIEKYIVPLGAHPDGFGNYILRIGQSRVLWSAHTDTVHRMHGRVPVEVVRLELLSKHGVKTGEKHYVQTSRASCLGADDTTGVWLLRNMVLANVPGLYVFHRAEETGCNGSNYIASETPELLDEIDYAIAFDRKGYDSVITHQCGGRTASDEFAKSLATAIGISGYKPDSTGLFTDTLEYAGDVPECTNVSVGYQGAHTSGEVQDLAFANTLCAAMLRFDESTLTRNRKPEMAKYWAADQSYATEDYKSHMERKYSASWADGDVVCESCGKETPFGYVFMEYDLCRKCFNALNG